MTTKTYRQGSGETYQVKALGPMTRTDNTPLNKDEISHYRRFLRYQDNDGNNGPQLDMNVALVEDANTPEYDGAFDEQVHIDDQAIGTYTFWYRTVLNSVDGKPGLESANSEALTVVILPPFANPNPPAGLDAFTAG